MQNNTIQDQNTIWLLIDSSDFGGIESHLLELAIGLKRENTDVRIVFMRKSLKNPLIDKIIEYGIDYSEVTGGIYGLFAHVKENRPAIIHTHGYHAGILGRLLTRVFLIKCVSTFHAGEKLSGKLAVYDWIDRHTAFLANHVISVSQKISTRIPTKNTVVNNFVDCRNLVCSRGCEIAFVGRLNHEKGPDLFLKVAELNPSQQFHIYGDGPLRSFVEELASDNVILHGQQTDMNRVWKRVGVLLITSRQEGLPMAALEAMGRGIPVIAFDVGALSRLIEHGENGWLVNPGEIFQLSLALNEWLALNQNTRYKIQKKARNTIHNHYSSHALIPQYQKLYSNI